MIVHLLDGTYELFRHFYGIRRAKGTDPPYGAVRGVLHTVVEMIESGAANIGVATDHVVESFRNNLWPRYKTGDDIEPALYAQFLPLEEALVAMGVLVWPMVELEADDALASAAHRAAQEKQVEQVCIWSPDKDLAQCVTGGRVVQVDRRSGQIRDATAVQTKFGVAPAYIPDYLAPGRRCGRWLSWNCRLRPQDCSATHKLLRASRTISCGGSQGPNRMRLALQEARDAANRCTSF